MEEKQINNLYYYYFNDNKRKPPQQKIQKLENGDFLGSDWCEYEATVFITKDKKVIVKAKRRHLSDGVIEFTPPKILKHNLNYNLAHNMYWFNCEGLGGSKIYFSAEEVGDFFKE